MRNFCLMAFTTALAAFPFSYALACGPGPGKGPQAQLGDSKAKGKFANGQPQSTVQLELLDRALRNISKKCGEQDIDIVSGYRSPAYNASINGAKASQHMCGNAADIQFCKGKSLQEMCRILAEAGCGGIGGYPSFVQCDIGPVRTWGSCPKNRPPPDEPIADKGTKDQPPAAYDSTTPPEPGQQTAGAQDSPTNDQEPPPQQQMAGAPSSGQSSQGPQAAYPVPRRAPNNNYRAERGAGKPDANVSIEKLSPKGIIKGGSENPSSTITRRGDPVSPDGVQNPGPKFGQNSNPSRASWRPDIGGGFSGSGNGGTAGTSPEGPNGAAGGGAGPSSASFAGGGGGSVRARAPGLGGAHSAGANEVLSNFSGKPNLGGSALASAGSDVEAAMKNIQAEFGQNGARGLASEEEDDSLFSRCHFAHQRCLQNGCVSIIGGATK